MTFSSHDYGKVTDHLPEPPTIEIGTRVGHRNYGWMVGTVTLDATPGRVYVAWDCDRFWAANDSLEFISDLRPTPHQPTRPTTDERTDRCPTTR